MGLTIILLEPVNGNLLYAAENSNFKISTEYILMFRSLLMDNNGAVLMTLYFNEEMFMFRLPSRPSGASSWDTNFVLTQNNANTDKSIGFTLIHDDHN
jgi:hypothetical protein